MDSWKKATSIGPTSSMPRGKGPATIGPISPREQIKDKDTFMRIAGKQVTREKLQRFLPDTVVDLLVPAVNARDVNHQLGMTPDEAMDIGSTAGVIKLAKRALPKVRGFSGQKDALVRGILNEFPRVSSTVSEVIAEVDPLNAGTASFKRLPGSKAAEFISKPETPGSSFRVNYFKPVEGSRISTDDLKTEIKLHPTLDSWKKLQGKDVSFMDTVYHELTHAAQNAFAANNPKRLRENELVHKYVPYSGRDREIGARATALARTTKELTGQKLPYREAVRAVTSGNTGIQRGLIQNPEFRRNLPTWVEGALLADTMPDALDPIQVVREIRRAGLETAGQLIGAQKRNDRIQKAIADSKSKRLKQLREEAKKNPRLLWDGDLAEKLNWEQAQVLSALSDEATLKALRDVRLGRSIRRANKRNANSNIQTRIYHKALKDWYKEGLK